MAGLDLKDFARRGAVARLAELQAEATAILKAFPELRKRSLDDPFTRRGVIANTDDGSTILPGKRRRRRKMTAAQRKAVGLRMKKYWAKRRKAQRA